ncbi:MAG: DUF2933 domain-containing protein [Rhodoferax sp.]|nr:DUF2933 domain-containing protein [Rhodoferax sp.]MDP3651793.1 DUF2933 domain-containing protein [Rhodoferax sp.]
MDHDPVGQELPPGFWGSRYAIGLVVVGAIAGYFLLTEHLAHVVGALPLLLLLACPLMHVFMHHGHGRHGHHSKHHPGGDGSETEPQKSKQPKPGGPP